MSENGEGGNWVFIGLDEKQARRQGLPARIPVPRDEFEGLAERGLGIAVARRWVTEFLGSVPPAFRSQEPDLVARYDAFLSKAELWERAQRAFERHDFKQAASSLKTITMVDKEDHAARLNYATALAGQGNHDAALKHLDAIRETFEGEAHYHLTLGQVLIAKEDRTRAAEELALALDTDPACKPAMDLLEQLGVLVRVYEDPSDAASLVYLRADSVRAALEEAWDEAQREAQYYLAQIAYHQAEQRFDVVVAAAERALALHPDAAQRERLSMARVSALRGLGRVEEAETAAREYLAQAPDSAWTHVELAQCLAAAGRADDARRELDRGLELDPGDQMALTLRFWPADHDDVAALLERIPELEHFAEAHADTAGVWRSLGRARSRTGSADKGLALMQRAVGLAPKDDDLRAEYWADLSRAGRHQQVVDDAAGIEDLAKRDWKLRWGEAEAYVGLGKPSEARAAFSAINRDESLHVDVRRRAKRAVGSLAQGG